MELMIQVLAALVVLALALWLVGPPTDVGVADVQIQLQGTQH
jgi:hypothetical protein